MALSGIPLPQVVAPTQPGGNALAALNAVNQTGISGAQAQYAPYQQYANALLTGTQAQYLPYQYMMQNMPMLMMALNGHPDLQQNLIDKMRNIPTATNGMNIPLPSAGLGSSLINAFLNKVGIGSNPNTPSGAPPGNALIQQPDSATTNPAMATNIATGQGAIPSSTINRAATGGILSGTNPLAIAQAQQEGLKTTATSEASGQQASWKDIIDRDSAKSDSAINNISNLQRLKQQYPNLHWYEKGPVFGNLPAFSGAAQNIDMVQSALADSIARAQQEGHISANDRAIYSNMKPGRQLGDAPFNQQVDFGLGMNRRLSELPGFDNAAQQYGLNPAQRNAVWSYYMRTHPFWDTKNNAINEDNLGSWGDILNPDEIAKALSPAQQKLNAQDAASAQANIKNSITQSPGVSTPSTLSNITGKPGEAIKIAQIKMGNGDIWNLPEKNVLAALSRDKNAVRIK